MFAFAEEEDVGPLLLARAHQPRRQVDRRTHHRVLTAVGRAHQPAEDIARREPDRVGVARRPQRVADVGRRRARAVGVVLVGPLPRPKRPDADAIAALRAS